MVILPGLSHTRNACCGLWLGDTCVTVLRRVPGCDQDPTEKGLQ